MSKEKLSALHRYCLIAGALSVMVLLITPRALAGDSDLYLWTGIAGATLSLPLLPTAWATGREKGWVNAAQEALTTLICGGLIASAIISAGNSILALNKRTKIELPVLSTYTAESTGRRGQRYTHYYIETLDLLERGGSRSFDVGGFFSTPGSYHSYSPGKCLILERGDGVTGWPVIFDMYPRQCSPGRGTPDGAKPPMAGYPRSGPITAWRWIPDDSKGQGTNDAW